MYLKPVSNFHLRTLVQMLQLGGATELKQSKQFFVSQSDSEQSACVGDFPNSNNNTSAIESKPVSDWDFEGCIEWLRYVKDLQLGQSLDSHYALAFKDNGIDGPILLVLTDGLLQSIGVVNEHHRKILLREIATLRNKKCTLGNNDL